MHLRVVCCLDWRLEVFLYYKIKNAEVYNFSIIYPNIYFRTTFFYGEPHLYRDKARQITEPFENAGNPLSCSNVHPTGIHAV